jgi:ketosteroid isomerase-like protein
VEACQEEYVGIPIFTTSALHHGSGQRYPHTKGRAAYEKGLASMFARRQGTPSLSVTTVFVRFLKPDVAIASGTWTETGGAPGPAKGSWMAAYVQQGGKWLMSSGLAAVAPPPPPR